MRLLLALLVVSSFVIFEASAIQCYYGSVTPNDLGELTGASKVKVMTCPKTHRCCSKVTSGRTVSMQCAKECPNQRASCGPEGKTGITGASWCYCRSFRDKNCQP